MVPDSVGISLLVMYQELTNYPLLCQPMADYMICFQVPDQPYEVQYFSEKNN